MSDIVFRCELCGQTSALAAFVLYHDCPQLAPPLHTVVEFTPRVQVPVLVPLTGPLPSERTPRDPEWMTQPTGELNG